MICKDMSFILIRAVIHFRVLYLLPWFWLMKGINILGKERNDYT